MKKNNNLTRNEPALFFEPWIGSRVMKHSQRPFKSTFQVNTVKGITTNPNTGLPAFTFYEDEMVVDCYRCKLLNE